MTNTIWPFGTLLGSQVEAQGNGEVFELKTPEQAAGSLINSGDRRSNPSPQPVVWGRAIPELWPAQVVTPVTTGVEGCSRAAVDWLSRILEHMTNENENHKAASIFRSGGG